MILGYNTNGFAFHRINDAIGILSELGYRCIALTIDHNVLDPYQTNVRQEVDRVRVCLEQAGMLSVIETGTRFLLDPRRKHRPTLLDRLDSERERRADFLRRCVDIAGGLGSLAVSFWSGSLPHGRDEETAFELLSAACRELADYAAEKGVVLAFEPEPGMFIDTLARYQQLASAVARWNFKLTIDIGHLQCNETEPASTLIARHAAVLANVHLDDMRRGVHDHLFFGEGEVDFRSVFAALRAARYAGPTCVELSRHSHDAVETARRAKVFLDRVLERCEGQKGQNE